MLALTEYVDRPPEALDPGAAAVTIAVMRGARTGGEVAADLKVTRPMAWRWLRLAREEGLVGWTVGKKGKVRIGSLQPKVGVVMAASDKRRDS